MDCGPGYVAAPLLRPGQLEARIKPEIAPMSAASTLTLLVPLPLDHSGQPLRRNFRTSKKITASVCSAALADGNMRAMSESW
jgi:hypothetical protein